jgi:two-component system LytT family response regulator
VTDRVRALIVDDEPLARRGVRQLLGPYPDIEVVGECRNGKEAVRSLGTLLPDLVFLDIQMPDLDGFGVIRTVGAGRMPAVVFVTAHDAFAVRAFEAQALDYLVKPLSASRFRTTVNRVLERIRREAGRGGQRIMVPTEEGDVLLDTHQVDWIGAEDYYVRVHVGGTTHRIRESLAAFEERLDAAQFVRVHRAAIVRLDCVRELHESGLILRDGTRIPVSRRRQARVRYLLRQSARRSLHQH